jgi:hypothetical protein
MKIPVLLTSSKKGLFSQKCSLSGHYFKPRHLHYSRDKVLSLTGPIIRGSAKSSSCLETRRQLPSRQNLILFVTSVVKKIGYCGSRGGHDSSPCHCATNGDIAVFIFDYGMKILVRFPSFMEWWVGSQKSWIWRPTSVRLGVVSQKIIVDFYYFNTWITSLKVHRFKVGFSLPRSVRQCHTRSGCTASGFLSTIWSLAWSRCWLILLFMLQHISSEEESLPRLCYTIQ